jgi:RIO-like serine/threonine protein kinase
MSNEDKVLLAIFDESKKDSPNISKEITKEKLNMDPDEFNIALKKLSDLELIKGANIILSSGNIVAVFTKNISITDTGKEYVSKNLL